MVASASMKGHHTLVAVLAFCFVAQCGGKILPQSASVPSSPPSTTLDLVAHVDYLDATAAREPMIVEHPDGTLFVSGYTREPQTVPTLWKSSDHGATWGAVDVGTEADGALGNSDVDLAVAQDGTLFFVTLSFNRKTGEDAHIAIGVSKDIGKTWCWTMLSKQPHCDRPWVAVAPDGAAHVIWSSDSGVYYTASRDRGATWRPVQEIHSKGGSSHLAVGPKSELAVRIIPLSGGDTKIAEGVDLVAVSTDGGATWQKRPSQASATGALHMKVLRDGLNHLPGMQRDTSIYFGLK